MTTCPDHMAPRYRSRWIRMVAFAYGHTGNLRRADVQLRHLSDKEIRQELAEAWRRCGGRRAMPYHRADEDGNPGQTVRREKPRYHDIHMRAVIHWSATPETPGSPQQRPCRQRRHPRQRRCRRYPRRAPPWIRPSFPSRPPRRRWRPPMSSPRSSVHACPKPRIAISVHSADQRHRCEGTPRAWRSGACLMWNLASLVRGR